MVSTSLLVLTVTMTNAEGQFLKLLVIFSINTDAAGNAIANVDLTTGYSDLQRWDLTDLTYNDLNLLVTSLANCSPSTKVVQRVMVRLRFWMSLMVAKHGERSDVDTPRIYTVTYAHWLHSASDTDHLLLTRLCTRVLAIRDKC